MRARDQSRARGDALRRNPARAAILRTSSAGEILRDAELRQLLEQLRPASASGATCRSTRASRAALRACGAVCAALRCSVAGSSASRGATARTLRDACERSEVGAAARHCGTQRFGQLRVGAIAARLRRAREFAALRAAACRRRTSRRVCARRSRWRRRLRRRRRRAGWTGSPRRGPALRAPGAAPAHVRGDVCLNLHSALPPICPTAVTRRTLRLSGISFHASTCMPGTLDAEEPRQRLPQLPAAPATPPARPPRS